MLVDARPPVAAAATGDRNHARCVDLAAHAPRPLLVPGLVVAEVACVLEPVKAHADLPLGIVDASSAATSAWSVREIAMSSRSSPRGASR